MKIIRNIVITLAFLLLVPLAHAGSAVYSLQVDGLACPFCAYGIEKKLSAIDGVEKIDVDIKSGQVIVTMANGASLSEDRARQAVKDAGFTLRAFTQGTGIKKE
ncbi:MAG: heavy-metal-associated domain-containing protein [Acidiferrobacterales bacterium]